MPSLIFYKDTMKKILFGILVATIALNSCKQDNYYNTPTLPNLDANTQNSYDDQAIQDYLNNNYITSRGKITSSATDANDSSKNNTKLSDLSPVKLPSGVIYIVIPNAQPTNGTDVHPTDYITFQQAGYAMRAIKSDNKIEFTTPLNFFNTIDGGGVPLVDPQWYYVKQSVLDAAKANLASITNPTAAQLATTQRSYYEIEGFQEAIQKFRSFNLDATANYNLQGIIIVPSRAAFGKDPYYNYTGTSLNDVSFVFNFQLYSARARNMDNPAEK